MNGILYQDCAENVFEALYEDKDYYLSPFPEKPESRSLHTFQEFSSSEPSLPKYARNNSNPTDTVFEELHKKVNDLLKSASETSHYVYGSKSETFTLRSRRTPYSRQYFPSDLESLRECLKGVGRNPLKHFHFSILFISAHPLKSNREGKECRLDAAARIISECWHKYVFRKVYIYLRNLIRCYEKVRPSILRFINPSEASLVVDPTVGSQLRFRLEGGRFPPTVLYKVYTKCPVVCLHFRNKKGKSRYNGRCRECLLNSKNLNCWRQWKDRYSSFPQTLKQPNTRHHFQRHPLSQSYSSERFSKTSRHTKKSASFSSTSHLKEFPFSDTVSQRGSQKPDHSFNDIRFFDPVCSISQNNLSSLEEDEDELMSWAESI